QKRYHDYTNIGEKVANVEALTLELKKLNQDYADMVENYAKEAAPKRRDAIRQKWLSEEITNIKLNKLEYLLQYRQASEPKTATVPALVNVKRSIWGPEREDTPHSVTQAFKELGSAVINDVWAIGQKVSD